MSQFDGTHEVLATDLAACNVLEAQLLEAYVGWLGRHHHAARWVNYCETETRRLSRFDAVVSALYTDVIWNRLSLFLLTLEESLGGLKVFG